MLKQILIVSVVIAAIAVGIHYTFFTFTPSPIISLKNGKIQGIVQFSRNGNEFYSYMGIPYAKPPIADLRFESPKSAAAWVGIHDASYFRSECLQLEFFVSNGAIFGSEDCLYINVFVPKRNNPVYPLPVMAYIHGGIFHVGSPNSAGAAYFMDEKIILVTFSYRLGALGFLSTGNDSIVKGNMGLKDQNLALRWIQENIKEFGGDPSKVTLFGESAGGASVHHHLLSPKSKGLFWRVIHQSGSTMHYWAVQRYAKEQAIRFANKFNCPVHDMKLMVNCLKNLDGKVLVGGHSDLVPFLKPKIAYFGPSIESINDASAFLNEEPEDLLQSGRFNKVPILTGCNAKEGLLFSTKAVSNQTHLNEISADWENWVPLSMHFDSEDPQFPKYDYAKKLKQFYFPNRQTINDSSLVDNFTNLFGDRYFTIAMSQSALLTSQYVPTYVYLLDHKGGFSCGALMAYTQGPFHFLVNLAVDQVYSLLQANVFGKEVFHWGTSHGDELGLLFSGFQFKLFFNTTGDTQMSKDMVKLWADFATNKKPLSFRSVQFPKVINGELKTVRLSHTNPSVIHDPFKSQLEFWTSLRVPRN